MNQLLTVAGVILVAVVAYGSGFNRGKRIGYLEGWHAFAKSFQEEVHRLPPSPPEPWI